MNKYYDGTKKIQQICLLCNNPFWSRTVSHPHDDEYVKIQTYCRTCGYEFKTQTYERLEHDPENEEVQAQAKGFPPWPPSQSDTDINPNT